MSHQPLQGRRKAFAEKIAEGHTATEAYLLAGYHAAKRETAHRAASRLYTNPGIRAYIQELRRAGDALAREETTLTIAQKLTFLARLVLTSSATLRDDDPLIQSHRILKDGTTSIRMPCKLKALKMHSELAGHFHPEPTAQTDRADLIQQLLDRIRQSIGDPAREPQSSRPVATSPAPSSPVQPLAIPAETPPVLKPTSLPNVSPEQNSKPQPTTTSPCDVTSLPPPSPRTPAELRRLVQAQIRQSSPLYHPSPPSSPANSKKASTTLYE